MNITLVPAAQMHYNEQTSLIFMFMYIETPPCVHICTYIYIYIYICICMNACCAVTSRDC